ncbi:MAG: hypothetical protein QXU82_03175 [Candidatus Aenigmatarchaeota archaeon]
MTQNPYKLKIGEKDVEFRANLNEAAKVPVYPSELEIKKVLLGADVEKVRIAFISNDTENSYYAVDGFEIAYKLGTIYVVMFGESLPIESLPANSSAEVFANATAKEPVIFMKGPGAGATKTQVTLVNNTVIVEGPDLSEEGRTYTDLDLAVDKLLLVLLGQ